MNLLLSTFRSFAVVVFVVSSAPQSEAHRRVLLSNETVADFVGAGDQPRFTITVQVQGPDDAGNSSFWDVNLEPQTISMDVIEAQPAITADTYIVSEDGTRIRFGDSSNSLATLLVSDVTTSAGRSGLTILAVDPITREMQGVTQLPDGGTMKILQGSDGGVVSAVEEGEMAMPAWEEDVEDFAMPARDEGAEDYENLLNRVRVHHDNDHNNHHDAFDRNISRSIRGTNANPLNKRRIRGTPANYQVKLFLEINRGFIKKTGGDGPRNANGIPQNVINYINTLVAAANVIFESEIDTRLVVHLSLIHI